MKDLRVHCYSGYHGEETPRFFYLGDKKQVVKAVLDRWISPDSRYFKVLTEDEEIYILRHDRVAWEWELIFYTQQTTSFVSGFHHPTDMDTKNK